jgi:N-acetylmuramoyl-L-alanine amidase
VDPGHPGAGSYGPTGLYEGDANLAIAARLIEMLEAAGAKPIVIRSDRGAVGLYERTRLARDAGAELFVSIHNNALPDGVRPFDRAGTSTFYYHAHSAALAGRVQEGMVRRMGLEDRGVLWGDLAVVREPWFPAVLAEGAFMMIPSHEAALRTPAFQERYARGVLEGIEAFLRDVSEKP